MVRTFWNIMFLLPLCLLLLVAGCGGGAAGNYSLTANPATVSLTAGGTGSFSVTASASNGFHQSVAVAFSGLPAGVSAAPSTLTLTPGTAQAVTLTAAITAAAAKGTVTLTGTSGSLTSSATVNLSIASPTATSATGPDVTTYHFDNTRQGLNAQETTLTLQNVNSTSFGLLGNYMVDGKVDAQPLYVGGLSLQSGTETHTDNVVYAATENDSVYALNAATGAQEWKSSVIGAGETVSDAPYNCGQILPTIGIPATPVIDRSYGPNGGIFVVGATKDATGNYHYRLHALDLTNGSELPGSPVEITATSPGTGVESQGGTITFAPKQQVSRVSMLLLNGTIYTAWGSHCDIAPYHGWILGYNEKTLTQTTAINLTPNGSDGAVWMSGYGLAADTSSNIYLLDANGTLDTNFAANGFPNMNDFGNGMLKLNTTAGLAVTDFFEPYNTLMESAMDLDLGAGGAMVLPDLTDSTGAVHQLLVGAGKDGDIYVGDRNNLGKYTPNATSNGSLYQDIPGALPNGAWSGPAYFNNTVYYAGVQDVLKAYTITNARLSTAPTSESPTSFAYPGTTPAVSADGTQNGIVWAVEDAPNAPNVLHAYDAANVANELYNSNQAPNGRDAFGMGNKFITPVISSGMVFVGTGNSVAVFGLLSSSSSAR